MNKALYKKILLSIVLFATASFAQAQSVVVPVTVPDSVVKKVVQDHVIKVLNGSVTPAKSESVGKAPAAKKVEEPAKPTTKTTVVTSGQTVVVNDTIRKHTVVEEVDTIRKVVVVEQQIPQYVAVSGTVNQAPEIALIRGRHIERVNRDELKATFIPKKIWMCGGAISYNEWDTENNNLLILKNLDWKGHVFSVNPYVGYAFKNNLVVGARFNYNRAYLNMGNLDVNLGEDLNINLDHLYYLEHTFEGGIFLRNYMPIGRSKVFGFFSEYRLNYGRTTGKNSTGTGADLDASYDRINYVQLGFTPGVSVFITNFAAAEVSVDAMGLKYRWGSQQTNRIEEGSTKSGSANFKINLFSINFGLTLYL